MNRSETISQFTAELCGAKSVYWWSPEGASSYLVGCEGEVFSFKTKRLLRGSECGIGYRAVNMRMDDGTLCQRYVHHLVAEAVLEPMPHECIRHIDGDLTNNSFSNLAYGTHLENMRDMKAHGRTAVGERNPQSRLTEALVKEIREKHSRGDSQHALAREYGVAVMTINRAVRAISWSHV